MMFQNKDWGDCCSQLWEDLSEVRQHLLNAQKELLLTVKAVVDLVLDKTEPQSHTTTAHKVPIK